MIESKPAEEAASFPPAVIAWFSVAILLLLGLVSFLDRQVISLMVGMIKADLGVSDFQVSLLQGFAFGLLYALGGLPLGWAVDRYPRRWVIFGGVFFWSVAAVCCGLATTFPVLLAARVGVGIGEAALGPAAYSMLADLFPKRRLALVISIYAIGSSLGSALALVIGGAVLSWASNGGVLPFAPELRPWQIAFIVTGAPGLLLAFFVFLMPEPVRRRQPGEEAGSWTELKAFMARRRKFLVCHLAGFACCLTMAYAHLSWTAAILERSFGWSVGQVGARLGLVSAVSGICGLLLNGAVADALFSRGVRDAHLRYYTIAVLVAGFGAVLAMFAPGPWSYLACMLLAIVPLNFIGVAAAALQITTPAALRGRMSALFLATVSIMGLTLGPSLPALITDYVFHDDAAAKASLSLTLAILAPIAALLFFLGLRPMREAVDDV